MKCLQYLVKWQLEWGCMSKMLPPSLLGLFLYECSSSWKLADDNWFLSCVHKRRSLVASVLPHLWGLAEVLSVSFLSVPSSSWHWFGIDTCHHGHAPAMTSQLRAQRHACLHFCFNRDPTDIVILNLYHFSTWFCIWGQFCFIFQNILSIAKIQL